MKIPFTNSLFISPMPRGDTPINSLSVWRDSSIYFSLACRSHAVLANTYKGVFRDCKHTHTHSVKVLRSLGNIRSLPGTTTVACLFFLSSPQLTPPPSSGSVIPFEKYNRRQNKRVCWFAGLNSSFYQTQKTVLHEMTEVLS